MSPPRTPPHAGQQPPPVEPASGEQDIQPLAIQGVGEETVTVEPQSRLSDHSRLPESKEKPSEAEGEEKDGGSEEAELISKGSKVQACGFRRRG